MFVIWQKMYVLCTREIRLLFK